MPLFGTAVEDAALLAIVGTFPDDGQFRLYVDNPATNPASELPADGGYAPAPHNVADWSTTGVGVATADVSYGTSTGAYGDVAYYWAVTTATGVVVLWDLLPTPIAVTTAGTSVGFTAPLYFRDDA